MFKLDDNLLRELGLGTLPAHEKNKMLGHIYETLEMRVGMKLAEQMTNEQLDEFEGYIDRNDEPGALKWLETNFPNYKQVVADELEKLKAEVSAVAPQIVAASLADPANQAMVQSPAAQATTQPSIPATTTQPPMPQYMPAGQLPNQPISPQQAQPYQPTEPQNGAVMPTPPSQTPQDDPTNNQD